MGYKSLVLGAVLAIFTAGCGTAEQGFRWNGQSGLTEFIVETNPDGTLIIEDSVLTPGNSVPDTRGSSEPTASPHVDDGGSTPTEIDANPDTDGDGTPDEVDLLPQFCTELQVDSVALNTVRLVHNGKPILVPGVFENARTTFVVIPFNLAPGANEIEATIDAQPGELLTLKLMDCGQDPAAPLRKWELVRSKEEQLAAVFLATS